MCLVFFFGGGGGLQWVCKEDKHAQILTEDVIMKVPFDTSFNT